MARAFLHWFLYRRSGFRSEFNTQESGLELKCKVSLHFLFESKYLHPSTAQQGGVLVSSTVRRDNLKTSSSFTPQESHYVVKPASTS